MHEKVMATACEQKLVLNQFVKILKRIGFIKNANQVESCGYEGQDWLHTDCDKLSFSVTINYHVNVGLLIVIREICNYDISFITPGKNGKVEVMFSPLYLIDAYRMIWVKKKKDRFFQETWTPGVTV
jgi:hypothetical protein